MNDQNRRSAAEVMANAARVVKAAVNIVRAAIAGGLHGAAAAAAKELLPTIIKFAVGVLIAIIVIPIFVISAMPNMFFGYETSEKDSQITMREQALSIGADTFQFFTRNPRGGSVKPFDRQDADALNAFLAEHRFAPILAHAPYTLNACAADASIREFAIRTMREDLQRLAYIPTAMLNFHPGSHVKQGVEVGVRYIADLLDAVMTDEVTTPILLETMAGKGSEIGRSFEELRQIIDTARDGDKLGVCLDTCHVYDAGYDVVRQLDDVLCEFDRVLGLACLKAIHLNDSKNPMGSHKDRHERIGKGSLGTEAIAAIINHPALQGLSFYLETPNELDGYAREIALLRGLYKGE